jgi:hypothetical protein
MNFISTFLINCVLLDPASNDKKKGKYHFQKIIESGGMGKGLDDVTMLGLVTQY